ncbi:hypothetical protein E1297_01630 [Roseibium sp. RKSG952]|nr:hypothetical protein [Roseibium sp. RKSG952]
MLNSQEILDLYRKTASAAGLALEVEMPFPRTFEMRAGDVSIDVSLGHGQMSSIAKIDGRILESCIFYLDPVDDGIGLDRDVEVFFWHLHEIETEIRRRAHKKGIFGKERLASDFILETVVSEIGRVALGKEEGNWRAGTSSEIKLVKRARQFSEANYDRSEAMAILKSARALRKPSANFIFMQRRASAALAAKKVVRIREYEWNYKMTPEAAAYINEKLAAMRLENAESAPKVVAKPGMAA